jgi:hypothetical protein
MVTTTKQHGDPGWAAFANALRTWIRSERGAQVCEGIAAGRAWAEDELVEEVFQIREGRGPRYTEGMVTTKKERQ